MKILAFVITVFIITTMCQAAELFKMGNDTNIMQISGVNIENMTIEESMVLLGPGHNFNVSKDGILTMENGTRWKINDNIKGGFRR